MRHAARQFEIAIPGEPFALVQETATDGERATADARDRERARAEFAARNQPALLPKEDGEGFLQPENRNHQ